MNGIQSRKAPSLEKQVPGCLGRMVNLFDLSSGVSRNRLLTDKPHNDGFSLSRSQSDVVRIFSPIRDQLDDKLMAAEFRRNSSNGKLNGPPMKMLIAQEMSKEVESKHNSPNLVAKLMGLEALPPVNSPAKVINSKVFTQDIQAQSAIPLGCWQEHEFLGKQRHSEIIDCQEQSECKDVACKDVYEIRQQSEKRSPVKDSSPGKGTDVEDRNEKKMALIRQKFIEAKRLSTDEKLRQSKEFQDALELLNSNKDLLIKFLQEPNSMFSQKMYDIRSSPPPQTRRITVLRPSKIMEDDKVAHTGKNTEKLSTKSVWTGQSNGWDKVNHRFPRAFSDWRGEDDSNPSQPTRIVVLKPSPGKTRDIKTMASLPASPPTVFNGSDPCGRPEQDEEQECSELAKEINHHIHENLSAHRRDETLLSSVLSNGYIGDESSFNKSEHEYEVGNLSDSEFMSPSSRHSWDHVNRFGSPYSSSSFGRVSFSPESSVCREAKKRLSERWAMMASNGGCQEQRHERRNSSTLGEMLALPDMKKSVGSDEEITLGEGVDNCPRSLLRSKSVPVSSTVYGDRLNVEISNADISKTDVSKELTKAKSGKSSFRGKVSSLFFSRTKKSSKSLSKSECHSVTAGAPGFQIDHSVNSSGDMSPCVNESGPEESLSSCLHGSLSKTSSPDLVGMEQRRGILCNESVSYAGKSAGKSGENQEQPSPSSVLDPPFEEDDYTTLDSCSSIKQDWHARVQVPIRSARSNLIDKSPPIEPMVRRVLSWDEYSAQLATPDLLKQHLSSAKSDRGGPDWLFLVQTLLSAAGLGSEVQSNSFFAGWYSAESPLGPALQEEYVNHRDKDLKHEAKRRQQRSNRKLVFDCVNAALVQILSSDPGTSLRPGLCNVARDGPLQGPSSILLDRVWAIMKEWCRSKVAGYGRDSNSLVVESVVMAEVVGGGWMGGLRSQAETVGQEIGGKLLEELLEEAVIELTGRL